MIIIYNLQGLLVGIAGVAFGGIILYLTRSLTLAIIALTMIWIAYGRASTDKASGEKKPAPSVFFIPLFYWGILTAFLTVPALGIDFLISKIDFVALEKERVANADPREALFRHDEQRISADLSDDPVLSLGIKTMMAAVLPGETFHVGIKSTPESVLILMSINRLKKIEKEDRRALLAAIRQLAESNNPEKKIYIGIKGDIFYGAVSSPKTPADVGSLVSNDSLFDFYGPKPIKTKPGSERPEPPVSALSPENVLPANSGETTAEPTLPASL
jgi:hypothetical protein